MGQVSVAEVAKRLGVGVQRVHQRIADGSLPAERVGSQWVVNEADILPLSDRRGPGRPLSPRSAWALVAIAAAQAPEGPYQEPSSASWLRALAPAERSRAKRRLNDLLAVLPSDPSSEAYADAVPILAARLRSLLRNRADRRPYRASPRDLEDIRGDDRLLLAGLSHPNSGISSGDIVEAYLAEVHRDDLVDDFLLDEVSRDSDANVILHVVANSAAAWQPPVDRPILLAADLAEHRSPREQARAAELLRSLADSVVRSTLTSQGARV
jgi:excisionase family DNA binding protein